MTYGPDIQFIWISHNTKNINYLFVVDRLTGYIQADKVPNQQPSAAILGVRKWAAKFEFPYKVISNSGVSLRDDFINQLEGLGIAHKPSSAYHPASNSLAERAVQSLKSVLRKSSEKFR